MLARRLRLFVSVPVTLLVLLAGASLHNRLSAQVSAPSPGTSGGEWRSYGGDLASTRYAPLDQINRDNFSKLEVAWRFKTDAFGPRPEINFEGTPLMAGGVLYATVGTRRAVVALNPATGEFLWTHRGEEGPPGDPAPRRLSGPGLPYLPHGRGAPTFYV